MRLGIRSKFIAILVVASFLPLLLGLISIRFLGKETYCTNKGELFQAMAQYLARNVEQHILLKVEHVHDWVQYNNLGRLHLDAQAADRKTMGDAEHQAARELDARWPGLGPDSPEMQKFLTNARAVRIQAFMAENPLFVEAFLTDRHGRLVAMSNKTSDYWQADEVWWQKAAVLEPEQVYVEGIHFDESAGAYTLDVAIPVWADAEESPVFTGVLKAVLNAGPLFTSITPILTGKQIRRDIVYGDGRILLELFGSEADPLSRRIRSDPAQVFGDTKENWTLMRVTADTEEVTGYAALELGRSQVQVQVISGLEPMYMVVHKELNAVMAPFYTEMTHVAVIGGLLVLLFFFLGDLIANRKIIRPLKVLRRAAQQISRSAHLAEKGDVTTESGPQLSAEEASNVVAQVADIHTQDEIQDLAGDFGRMSDRVMNYHAQLEKEIANKTEEIQGDLAFAREFQEGLMPLTYPRIPSRAGADSMELHFHHVYQPASSVSGDFFDIQKIDDHSAGIIIADVMGHGARSALITAILRTLIQNFRYAANEPGQFLTLLNKAFLNIIPDEDVIFATVLYLVVNTRKNTVTYCSAGHMSPLLVRRETEVVQPLFHEDEGRCQYAIGLMPETQYRDETLAIQLGDVLLLYTDGVVEAMNAAGEEFGEEHLIAVVKEAREKPLPDLCESVVAALNQFMNTVVAQDDVCLVAVEAALPGSLPAPVNG